MNERAWNSSMSNLSEKELEIALYIYIGQNIRNEGILVQDPFLVKNEKIVKELENRGIIEEFNWYKHSLLRINYNENVNLSRIIEGKLNENKDILLESLNIIPLNLLSFFIHDYIENKMTFPLDKDWSYYGWKSLILDNEKIQKYKIKFFNVLIKFGFSVKTKSYVSTRGGELRDDEYVISTEIRDSLRRIMIKIEIPNEIILFSTVYDKILREVRYLSGIIEFTIEEDEYLGIEMRLLEDAFGKILDKLYENDIIDNYRVVPKHGIIVVGDANKIHNFILNDIDNTIIETLISDKFAYKDEEKIIETYDITTLMRELIDKKYKLYQTVVMLYSKEIFTSLIYIERCIIDLMSPKPNQESLRNFVLNLHHILEESSTNEFLKFRENQKPTLEEWLQIEIPTEADLPYEYAKTFFRNLNKLRNYYSHLADQEKIYKTGQIFLQLIGKYYPEKSDIEKTEKILLKQAISALEEIEKTLKIAHKF